MPPRCTICDHPDLDEINQALAANKESTRSIANRFDVNRSSIQRHGVNHLPTVVTEAVQARRLRAGSEVLDVALVDQEERLKRQSDRWERLHRVIEQRAEAMKDVAEGGDTGLLVRKVKSIGSGEYAERVDEYAVDAPMLKEIRELEKQTSEELGQSKEKGSAGSGAGPAVIIIQPKLILPPGVTTDLPVVNPVRFPDGAPAGYLDAPPIDEDQDIIDVDVCQERIDVDLDEEPEANPPNEEIVERDGGIDSEEDDDYF